MRRAHLYLIAILVHHLVAAILYETYFWCCFPDGGGRGEWLTSPATYWVPLLILLYLWLRADLKDRNIGLPTWTSVLAPIFFPLGVPYYFLRTYPLRAGASRIALAILFVGVCVCISLLGFRLTFKYYAVWTNPTTLPPSISLERTRG